MTREDAIEILQGVIKKPNTKDGYLGQAIDMAIKALEQEPILDKIRNQILSNLMGVNIALDVLDTEDPLRKKMKGAKDTLEDCLELIDKAENEGSNYGKEEI